MVIKPGFIVRPFQNLSPIRCDVRFRQLRWACVVAALIATSQAHAQGAPPAEPQTEIAGPWRLRLDAGHAIELGDTTRGEGYAAGVRISVDLVPNLALQAGFGMEGVSAGLRLQYMTERGWQLWLDGMAGFRGYVNLPNETMWGFGTAIGTSLRVNERFLIGPYVRYAHYLETASADADLLAFGIQLDLVIARRNPRPSTR